MNNNNNNNNNNSNILLLVALFENDMSKINTFNEKEKIFTIHELNFNNVIEKIKTFVKNIDSTQITIYLLSNILADNEQIFLLNDFSLSIEDVIHTLENQCYNRNEIFIKINKKIIFKSFYDAENLSKIIQIPPYVQVEDKTIINDRKIDLIDTFKNIYYGVTKKSF